MYRQQLKRLERKYNVLLKRKGSIEDQNVDETRDLLLSFFQDCWHLKDWLLNSTQVDKNKLYSFLSNSKEMNMCREICTVSKHPILHTPTSRVDSRLAKLTNIGIPIALGREYDYFEEKVTLTFWFQDTYDAFELAAKCLSLWQEFIKTI